MIFCESRRILSELGAVEGGQERLGLAEEGQDLGVVPVCQVEGALHGEQVVWGRRDRLEGLRAGQVARPPVLLAGQHRAAQPSLRAGDFGQPALADYVYVGRLELFLPQ